MAGSVIASCNGNGSGTKRFVLSLVKPFATLLFALIGTVSSSILAGAIDQNGLIWNRVSLACWIENEKVIAVVNSTGKTLPAGTKLSVDAIRIPDGSHYRKSTTMGRTPTGGIIRMGAVPSSSCSASARLPMPVLKTQ